MEKTSAIILTALAGIAGYVLNATIELVKLRFTKKQNSSELLLKENESKRLDSQDVAELMTGLFKDSQVLNSKIIEEKERNNIELARIQEQQKYKDYVNEQEKAQLNKLIDSLKEQIKAAKATIADLQNQRTKDAVSLSACQEKLGYYRKLFDSKDQI